MDHVDNPYSSSRPVGNQGYLQNGADLSAFTVDDPTGGDMSWDLSVDQLPAQTFLSQPDYSQNGSYSQLYPSLYETPQSYNSQFAHDATRFQNTPYNFQSYSPAPVSYGQPEMAAHASAVSQHPLQGYQMLQDQTHRTFSPAQAPHQQNPIITQQQYDPELQQQWGQPSPARSLYSPHPVPNHQSPPRKSPVPVQQTSNDNMNLFAQMPAYQVSNLQPRPVVTPEPKSQPPPQQRLSPYPILPAESAPAPSPSPAPAPAPVSVSVPVPVQVQVQVQAPAPVPSPVPDAKPQPAAEASQPSRVPINSVPRQNSPAPTATLLRITNADLLTKFGAGSPERLAAAPFLVMTGDPVNLEIKGKTTIPKYHPRGNRSGKPVAGHQLSIAAAPAKITRALKPKPAPRKYRGTKDVGTADVKLRVPRNATTAGSKPEVASPEITSEEEESSSAGEYTSDEEDEVMVIDKIEDHRAEKRPVGIAEAAGYDAVGLVWIERHRHPNVEEISKAIRGFQDFIGGLRDDIKKVTADIAKAETDKKPAEVKKLTANREVRRNAMTSALKAAKEHGHQDVLQNLSNSQKVVVALSMTLIDCVKAEDYGGALPRAVLELMTEFRTLTDELLKRAKFDSVQKRFSKKGDDSIKELLSIIAKNTLAYEDKLKKMKGVSDPPKMKVEDSKVQEQKKAPGEPSTTSSNLKRAHPGDGTNGQPAKKSTSSVKVPASKPIAQPATKVTTTPMRTSNIFSSLSKPGTKSAAAAAKAAQAKQAPKKESTTAPQQQSALAALLASIEKPKELPKAPATPDRAPETPEEKAKRERKESRRHLRVKFREGAELEQVRLFQHEQAEDEGRQEEMVRDAHDERSEGMMHKQRAAETKQDSDAMDEEEDLATEVEFRPYCNLIGVDLSTIDPSVLEKNFTSRGGNKTFTTPQQSIQGTREATELMAFYTADSDIPASAKEPANPYSGDARQEAAFGQPTDPKTIQRLREINQFGPERALLSFISKHAEGRVRSNHIMSANSVDNADITAILAAMNGNQQQAQAPQSAAMYLQQHALQSHQSSTPPPAIDWDIIRRAVEMTKGLPYPATEPPTWMSEFGKADWWAGYNKGKAAENSKLVESQRAVAAEKAAQMFADHTQQTTQPPAEVPQVQYQGYPQIPQMSQIPQVPQIGQVPQSQEDMDRQIQNLLAGMQGAAAAQFTQPQAFAGNAWWGAQFDASQNQNAQNQTPAHASRNWASNETSNSNYGFQNQNQTQQNARGWEDKYNENINGFDDNNGGNGNGGNGHGVGNGGFKRGGKRKWTDDYKKGTKPCKYFAEGKCLKGDKCTYRHDISEGLYG